MTETARLAALADFELMDTPPDRALDDITELAAHVCDTPISLITLVDSNRQWFKSRFGWDVPETAREFAFCTYAIARPDEILVINDATEDPRFADNPLVTNAPGIRFYAGWPLMTRGGHVLGTLCVIDRKARILEPHQMQALQALRRHVMSEFELRRAIRLLRIAEASNDQALELLRTITAEIAAARAQVRGDPQAAADTLRRSLATISQFVESAGPAGSTSASNPR